MTAHSNEWLPEYEDENQCDNQGNHGNRKNGNDAAGSNGAEPSGDPDLNKGYEQGSASPYFGRTFNRAGFRRRTPEGLWQYMALPEAWNSNITKSFDPHLLAREMVDRGLILPDPRGTPARLMSVKGHGKLRLYVFAPGILTGCPEFPATECSHEGE